MTVAPPILVILGPTASGKSSLALELASKAGAEILSVDSMQVYRGMDIGTAKPTAAQRAQVPHHLIDVVEPSEVFTVARYVELADEVIRRVAERRTPLVATGGTPLYYKGLFEGLFEGPPADPKLRFQLRALSGDELWQRLAAVDPEAASRIHRNDTKRLIRALEVYEATGQPISSLQTNWAAGRLRHKAVWIGLHWERDELNRRINTRVKAMLEAGWVDETQQLLKCCGSLSATAAGATGYHELMEHLQGGLSLEDAAEQIKIATRQLARRQMKWFRRFRQVHWLAGNQPSDSLTSEALALSSKL